MSDDILTPAEIEALLGSNVAASISSPAHVAAVSDSEKQSASHTEHLDAGECHERLIVERGHESRQSQSERRRWNRLWAMHEQAAREVGAALSSTLRTPVDVRLGGVEAVECGELERQLAAETAVGVLRSSAIPGQLAISAGPAILMPMLDRMIGVETSGSEFPSRPLSGVEQLLACRLFDQFAEQVGGSWETICPIGLRLDRAATDSRRIVLGPPGSASIVVAFDTRLGTHRGDFRFCIPPHLIDVLDERLASTRERSRSTRRSSHGVGCVMHSATEVTAELMPTTLSNAELASLTPGDVILTGHATTSPARICVDGEPIAEGELAATAGRKAVRVLTSDPPGSD